MSPATMHPDEAIQLALQHQQSGRIAQAESIYRQILQAAPAHTAASLNLGALLHSTQRAGEAIKVYRTAVAFDGSAAELWNNLGNVLLDQGEIDQSLAACRQA